MGSLTEKGVTSRPVNSGIYTVLRQRMQPNYARAICAIETLKLYSVVKCSVAKKMKVQTKHYLAKLKEPITKRIIIVTGILQPKNKIALFWVCIHQQWQSSQYCSVLGIAPSFVLYLLLFAHCFSLSPRRDMTPQWWVTTRMMDEGDYGSEHGEVSLCVKEMAQMIVTNDN